MTQPIAENLWIDWRAWVGFSAFVVTVLAYLAAWGVSRWQR